MNRTFVVAGEPALWLGSGYEAWKQILRDAIPPEGVAPPAGMMLEFRVTSLLRSGHRFDLDNLVSPVFQALLGPRASAQRRSLTWWRASIAEYRPSALSLSFCDEPAGALTVPNGELVLDCRPPAPYPTDSREGGSDFVECVRAELASYTSGPDDRFAVEIAFGSDVKDLSWVEERPLKPVIDCLYPVFGGTGGAPDDWKTFLLQVRRADPELDRACSVRIWRFDEHAAAAVSPAHGAGRARAAPPQRPNLTTTPRPSPITTPRRSAMSNYDRLDEAAKQLDSPPRELRLDDIIRRARALYPEMASSPRDGLSATMDYQTINVRGRASKPGDFAKSDRWNRSPAFLKVAPGVYRRLSDEERALFRKLFDGGEPLVRKESFDPAEWDALAKKQGR